jgi:F420-non-reducing hydrogenase iron-sulfur subunit
MCSGRVDPVMVIDAFLHGADGVFVGACLRGECHYSTGNLEAEGKMLLTQKILKHLGINPERLVMRWMSSAEGAKFVRFATEFQGTIKELGPLRGSEGLTPEEIDLKLRAAKLVVESKKVRWVVGKRTEFLTDGNLYGEIFTDHEIHRLFEEVVLDECIIQEILMRTMEKPHTVQALSERLSLPKYKVLRHLADMRRMGLVRTAGFDNSSPLWQAGETQTAILTK